jgi:hypothetical protein
MALNLIKWPPQLGLRHFGKFEEQSIRQEVFEQESFIAHSTAQLSTSVMARFYFHQLLA